MKAGIKILSSVKRKTIDSVKYQPGRKASAKIEKFHSLFMRFHAKRVY